MNESQIISQMRSKKGGKILGYNWRVRSFPSWNLNLGILNLSLWSRDFIPNNVNTTSEQVWMQIHALSQKYWCPNIIFAIASSIGTPICIDSTSNRSTLNRSFGNFMRVLVDIELMNEIKDKVLLERVGYVFFVYIEYEKLPEICHYYKALGHAGLSCRRKAYRVNKEARRNMVVIRKKTSNRNYFKVASNSEKVQNMLIQDEGINGEDTTNT